MQISLYNTLSRSIDVFTSIVPGKVGMYSCGPTVYGAPHIGNMRKYFLDDLIKNVIKYIGGYDVTHVVNITDVGHLTGENEGDADHGEDKMEKGARREGLTARDIAKKYEAIFHENCRLLKLDPFDFTPRATDNIPEQIAMVKQLEENGYTYTIEGDGIYMDTSKIHDYGKLMGENYKKHVDGLNAGERVNMGGRKNPTDFALWKFNMTGKKRDMEWESPRGVGFPGWHIECSAMSIKYLGNHFDIHTGGVDHIPVHHSNEIAQSECSCAHAPWVNYWLHYQFLNIKGEKIAKSTGNTITVQDVLDAGYQTEDLRYFYLQAHWSSFQDFTWEALEAARKARQKLKSKIQNLKFKISKIGSNSLVLNNNTGVFYQTLAGFLADNINTVKLISEIHGSSDNLTEQDLIDLYEIDTKILKLGFFDSEEKFAIEIPLEIQSLAQQRRDAKIAKDRELADSLREKLEEKGREMKDGKEDYELKLKN